ncbi:hypothetical protein SPHINGOAX6_70656 [Sphingomonas sp. AX6]|nr:hypothetical protein SPHINGOAX6_70656 [Sphingomonas sp. AX6]
MPDMAFSFVSRCSDVGCDFGAIVEPALHGAAEMRDRAHVEEVHHADHQHRQSDLCAEKAHRIRQRFGFGAKAERQGDEADIDEVEADDEQMIGRAGELAIMPETLGQKDFAIARQRARDPDRDADGDCQIEEVGNLDHFTSPSVPLVL